MNSSRILGLMLAFGAAVSMSAKIVTQTVAYEHAGVKLEGYLAYDDQQVEPGAKAPGVLVIPEWWGLTEFPKGRAVALARMGYVAFAADMYGAGIVTDDPKRAGELAGQFYGKPLMAARAQAGLDQLRASGLVDEARIAAIGYCFGGSTVQALAYTGAPLVGVVSFHGGLIPVPAEAAANTKAKILVCHGAVDGFVSAEELAGFTRAMNEGKFDYQFISYAGAVHAFTNPRADAVAKATGLPIAYHPVAAQRSWTHMRSFFREIFEEYKDKKR
jgi:dienelactone hydrolase